jgi:hypothetical protein
VCNWFAEHAKQIGIPSTCNRSIPSYLLSHVGSDASNGSSWLGIGSKGPVYARPTANDQTIAGTKMKWINCSNSREQEVGL